MKSIILFSGAILLYTNSISQVLLEYPNTRKTNEHDNYHGIEVLDEYRWLEDTQTDEVQQWVDAQNSVSKKYLSKCVSKQNTFNLIDRYSSIRYDYPHKVGKYFFKFLMNNNFAQPSIYKQNRFNQDPSLIVDPNYISRKDVISLRGLTVSLDNKYLAYQFSRNGSDWREIKVVGLNGQGHLRDHIVGSKYSGLEWKGNGFYYITYPNDGKFATAQKPQIFYHTLRENQENDKLVFQARRPTNQLYVNVSSDERFLFFTERDETNGYINIFYQDDQAEIKGLKPLFLKFEHGIRVLDNIGDDLIIRTKYESNTDYLVKINPMKPLEWKHLTPKYEDAELLYSVSLKDKIIAVYQFYKQPIISVFDYEGKLLKSIELPIGTSVGGFGGGEAEDELLFHLQSYIIPQSVYTFNTNTYEYKLKRKTEVAFDLSDFGFEELEATSKDGTKIPMFMVFKKGIEKSGNNPTLLKAYGGFGAIPQPSFDGGLVAFLQKGGIFVYANIRGGGEFGAEWMNGGRRLNKMNSFDDFIACAEKLVNDGYTNSKKLAITGGSQGGLVTGAAMVMRPDLFAAAVLNVGVFDMMRLEDFTVGQFHIDEYGTVKDSTDFVNMYSYSPLHNVKEAVNYPSCLILTSENDDRVPPFHSYKFASRLQNREVQKNPILLKVMKKAGHSGSSNKSQFINAKAEMFGFILQTLED